MLEEESLPLLDEVSLPDEEEVDDAGFGRVGSGMR